jgi:hypothetical protein
VHRVIEPEEYVKLSTDELYEQICQGLYVNEGVADGIFRSNKKAEYLERAIYVCPFCGLSKFESHGNEAECMTCHRKVLYGEDKTITGVGYDFPFRFMTEWYNYQNDFINGLDLTEFEGKPSFTDCARISDVILNKRKQILYKDAAVALYGNRITINEGSPDQMILPFENITAAACLGRNKLNVYSDGKVYQFKGSVRFNSLKYVNFYYRYKNISRGDLDGKFLGL